MCNVISDKDKVCLGHKSRNIYGFGNLKKCEVTILKIDLVALKSLSLNCQIY